MHRWIGVLTALASIMIVNVIFVPTGFPWTAIGSAGLTLAAAVWIRAKSERSTAQVIAGVGAEPTSAPRRRGPSAMKPFFI
jgi:hypothetical protein